MNKTILLFAVALLLTGFALADTTDNTTDDMGRNALDVRYAHLSCKVDFTGKQLELFNGINDSIGLLDKKETLDNELSNLKSILDDGNSTAFDKYVEETLRPSMQDATKALNAFKANISRQNLTAEEKTTLRNYLNGLRNDYSSCVSDKQEKMARLMIKFYDRTDNRWDDIIKHLKNSNITTTDLEKIKTELEAQKVKLQEAIDSGNATLIKETIKEIQDTNQKLWARFEIGKLNGYMKKLGKMAEKYGLGEKIKNIQDKLDNLDNYTGPGNKYGPGERTHVWQEIYRAGKDMRETSKEILQERINEQKREQDDRKGTGGKK